MTNKSEALRELAAVMEKHDIEFALDDVGTYESYKVIEIWLNNSYYRMSSDVGHRDIIELADQLEKGDGDE